MLTSSVKSPRLTSRPRALTSSNQGTSEMYSGNFMGYEKTWRDEKHEIWKKIISLDGWIFFRYLDEFDTFQRLDLVVVLFVQRDPKGYFLLYMDEVSFPVWIFTQRNLNLENSFI